MAEQTASSTSTQSVPADAVQITETPRSGDRITAEEYMEHYAHDFYEWVDGELIKMSPITGLHNFLLDYFLDVFRAYFSLNPIGIVHHQPFVMRIDSVKAWREPDMLIVLNTNPGKLTDTAMIGPADIAIEIVSDESVERDYGTKLTEYEQGGVPEYWLFDHKRKAAFFRRLNDQGIYETIQPDEDGNYTTPLLPGLKIHVPTLWQEPLPDFYEIADTVRTMLSDQ